MKTTNNQKPPELSNEPRPKLIYKYQDYTLQSLENLRSQTIYFNDPRNFNDLYDCASIPKFSELSSAQIKRARNYYLNDPDTPKEQRDAIETVSDTQLSNDLSQGARRAIEAHLVREARGVSCFSETNNNPLMWAHYAGGHKGFCLEFRTELEPLSKLHKAKYVKSVPKISPLVAIADNDELQQLGLDLFLTKSDSWSYEKEWRALHKKVGTPYTYPSEALSGIYFGPRMDDAALEVIYSITQGQKLSVDLYRGYLGDDFEIKFKRL